MRKRGPQKLIYRAEARKVICNVSAVNIFSVKGYRQSMFAVWEITPNPWARTVVTFPRNSDSAVSYNETTKLCLCQSNLNHLGYESSSNGWWELSAVIYHPTNYSYYGIWWENTNLRTSSRIIIFGVSLVDSWLWQSGNHSAACNCDIELSQRKLNASGNFGEHWSCPGWFVVYQSVASASISLNSPQGLICLQKKMSGLSSRNCFLSRNDRNFQ